MNIRTAGTALSLLLLAWGTAGCDRRDAEPIEPADSATTTVVDTPATPAPATTQDPTATSGGVPPIDTCAGLTGEAEVECLMRDNDGLPPSPPPVNPEEATEEDVPPTP